MPPPEYTWPEKPPRAYGDMRNMELDAMSMYGPWDSFKDWSFLIMMGTLGLTLTWILLLGWYTFLLEAVAGMSVREVGETMIPQIAMMTTVIALVIATIAICITYYRLAKMRLTHEKSMKQLDLDHDLQTYLARMNVLDKHNGTITVEQMIEAELGTLAGDAMERRGRELARVINEKQTKLRGEGS